MNADMFRAVADRIELEDRFNLNHYGRVLSGDGNIVDRCPAAATLLDNDVVGCWTVGCVAGWVNALNGNDNLADEEDAAQVLGIDEDQANFLFAAGLGSVWSRQADTFGWDVDDYGELEDWEQISAVQASKVLRMIADGEIEL
jgi:hypothetical protein